MKASTLFAFSILSIGLTACFDDSSSSTAPSPYTDVKSADLTTGDKSFLARLAGSADAFSAMSKSSQKAGNSAGESTLGTARALATTTPCTTPTITTESDWELGDSVSVDSFPGSHHVTWTDTTRRVDLATGTVDLTCDESASMAGYKEFSSQSSVEGNLLTSYWKSINIFKVNGDVSAITSMEDFAKLTMELTSTMKGVVAYTDGFTLDIDTANFHVAGPLLGLDPKGFDAWFHVNFRGYAYSSTMTYDKVNDILQGDVVRGSDRIGTVKVYNDDRMEVKDLDGKLITAQ